MLITVNTDGAVRLEGEEDFTRFGVRTYARSRGIVESALASIGRVEGDSYVWISQDALRNLAARRGDRDWEDGFAKMVHYARSKGWLDDKGGIRAHIENAEALNVAAAAGNAPVDVAAFKQAMRNLAGGVGIIATGTEGARFGLTASAITSVCAEPPTLLICVNKSSQSYGPLIANGRFGVSLLAVEHGDLAMRFAGSSLHGEAKFDGAAWETGVTGSPLLADALCKFECELVLHQEIGTHGIFIGRVVMATARSGEPLINFQGKLQSISG